MKKKEIISICKKNNYLYRGIYDGVQWIGTNQAKNECCCKSIKGRSILLRGADEI